MGGSLRDFSYTDDTGQAHAVLIDESNAKATTYSNEGLPALPLFLSAVAPFPIRPPKGFRMRSLNCLEYLSGKKQKFWVGNPAAYNQAKAGGLFIQRGSEYFVVLSLSPEKVPRPFINPAYVDSGLNDGTPFGQ